MKIWLNFIMKNESRVLDRMLKSVMPMVDGCVCIDTGSTDNSKEIVQQAFDKAGKPCEIYDHPFINFENARNHAIEKLKNREGFGFWIDCDEEFILPSDFNREQFNKYFENVDVVNAVVNYNSTSYARNCFFRINKPMYWSGPVHELLQCRESTRGGNIPDNHYVLVHPDGNSWTSQSQAIKYKDHAKKFEEYMRKNGRDTRSIFYYAQSMKDVNTEEYRKRSVVAYEERRDRTDGFYEERYWSQLQIGRLKRQLNVKDSEVIDEFMRCSEYDNLRAEHFIDLIHLYQSRNRWEAAYIISSHAMKFHNKNPYPTRLLFITPSVYTNDIKNMHIINCQNTNRIVEVADQLNTKDIYNDLCKTIGDINEHLPIIKEYAEKSQHVTEFGFRAGCTIYALLQAKPKELVSYDIHYHQNIEQVKILANKDNVNFQFKNEDVLKTTIQPTDLLLLDTVGTYTQLSQELQIHEQNVGKYIIIHDTEVYGERDEYENADKTQKIGLKAAIEQFLENNTGWTMADKYTNNHGLTILGRVTDSTRPRIIKFNDFEPKNKSSVRTIVSQQHIKKSQLKLSEGLKEVDVCIVSWAKTEELKQVTINGIETLLESEDKEKIKFNVWIVESNLDVNYDHYTNTKTIYPGTEFGYHKYLNIAVSHGNAPYVVLCNNDLTYEKGWVTEIIKQMEHNPNLLSASPLCPQIQNRDNFPEEIYYGTTIRRELAGWCFMVQRKIFDQIGKLDERYSYWFSDVDYGMELKTRNIQHALITNSVVNHHDGNHGITGKEVLLNDQQKANEYTDGQKKIFEDKWNNNKKENKQTKQKQHKMELENIYNRLCNTQSDINEHLPALRRYASKCNHITEMGVRWVVSSYALLSANPKKMVSYDINYNPNIDSFKSLAKKIDVPFEFIQANVLDIQIEKTEFLFIDTLHNYSQLVKELEIHSNNVSKYIAFHDTETFGLTEEMGNGIPDDNGNIKRGLKPAIEEFLANNLEWSLIDVYKNNNGLSVIERGNWENNRVTTFQQFQDKKNELDINKQPSTNKMKVFMIMWNRLTWPKKMAEFLTKTGCEVIMIDNASTYPPLLEWYEKECPYKVHRMTTNLGHWVLWHGKIIDEYPDQYYILTDPDLEIENIPHDYVNVLMNGLKTHPNVMKAGLSLEINDLPNNEYSQKVKGIENRYWVNKSNVDGYYLSWVDTTFALYDRKREFPGCFTKDEHSLSAIRTDRPYIARHLPWYLTKEAILQDEEEKYYHDRTSDFTYWSNILKQSSTTINQTV